MEGHDIKDNISPEQQQYPEKSKSRKIPFVIGITIGLILGIVISPFIMNIFSEDKSEIPIYQQYSYFVADYRLVFRNDKLNVTITENYDDFEMRNEYYANWIDIDGRDRGTFIEHTTPIALYKNILSYAEELSENQLKWFDYMLKNKVT